jgi:CubicO group peptidase (beta-lactamase class C family)
MIKRYIVPSLHFFSSILFIVFIASCGNIASEAKVVNKVTLNQDSVEFLLADIHAKDKMEALAHLYETKAKETNFNGCVLIAQHGQVLYKNAFGYANFATKDALKINSVFQLASASKPFTATAILMLAEQDMIELTDHVDEYIIGFPYPDITIEMLLTHRSGLNNYMYFAENYCDKNLKYNGKTFDNDALISMISKYKPKPYSPAGTKFSYCNTNYALLASIVEVVSELPFEVFMKRHIFTPLKMYNTWVYTPTTKNNNKALTVGHHKNGCLEKNTYADDIVGDKGVYSTVEDMLKWDQALYTETLLSKASLEKAFTGYSNEHEGKRNYGLGWRITNLKNGDKEIYHNGWWHGYNATFYRKPSNGITMILLSNRANKSAYYTSDILPLLDDNFYDNGDHSDNSDEETPLL